MLIWTNLKGPNVTNTNFKLRMHKKLLTHAHRVDLFLAIIIFDLV